MKNSVFRKSSVERVSSPEQLNDYIRIANPSVWLILASAIILLAGVIVWGIYGSITTVDETVAVSNGGNVICYVPQSEAANIKPGMEVRVGENAGAVSAITASPVQIGQDFDAHVLLIGGFKKGDWVYPVSVQIALDNGVYPAQIITEKLSPISFVLN